MAVRIGHASIDENGKIQGGTAGDQSKKEVCTRDWYNKPWICVIRAKDSAAAEKIAVALERENLIHLCRSWMRCRRHPARRSGGHSWDKACMLPDTASADVQMALFITVKARCHKENKKSANEYLTQSRASDHVEMCGSILVLSYRYLATGGGVYIGIRYNFFSRCCGWCSLPLHHQMVRQ